MSSIMLAADREPGWNTARRTARRGGRSWLSDSNNSLKAEINKENTINKKVKVKLYTNGKNKKNTKNAQIC